MSKINFTKEHKAKLDALSLDALIQGTEFKGKMAQNHTIYDLFHSCTLNTITQLHAALKKEANDIENMDEWSLTDYQQRRLKELQNKQEILNLLIGYKRNQAEVASAKEKLRELKALQTELKESTKTPEAKLAEIDAQIQAMETETV